MSAFLFLMWKYDITMIKFFPCDQFWFKFLFIVFWVFFLHPQAICWTLMGRSVWLCPDKCLLSTTRMYLLLWQWPVMEPLCVWQRKGTSTCLLIISARSWLPSKCGPKSWRPWGTTWFQSRCILKNTCASCNSLKKNLRKWCNKLELLWLGKELNSYGIHLPS